MGYYDAPSNEVFEDIKKSAICLWSTYDNAFKYASHKIAAIKDLENTRDNAAYMIAMFDFSNSSKLLNMVELESTKEFIRALLIEGR